MVDFPHLELFYGVGRGGHRHDDSPVIVEVMCVNVLQMLHEFRQHGGHLLVFLSRCLSVGVSGRSRSVPPGKTLAPLGDQIK